MLQYLVMLALAQGEGVILDQGGRVSVFDPAGVAVDFGGRSWVAVEPARVLRAVQADPRTARLGLGLDDIAAAWIARPHKDIDQIVSKQSERIKKWRV